MQAIRFYSSNFVTVRDIRIINSPLCTKKFNLKKGGEKIKIKREKKGKGGKWEKVGTMNKAPAAYLRKWVFFSFSSKEKRHTRRVP